MILSDALTSPVSQLQTQQVMTSQIRPHIEYSIQTCYIFCTHFLVEVDDGGFKYDLMVISDCYFLFGPPCISLAVLSTVIVSRRIPGETRATAHGDVAS